MKVRSPLVAGGLAAMLVIPASCGLGRGDPERVGQTATTLERPADAYRVGDVVKVADLQVVVQGFRDPYDGAGKSTPASGRRYVTIDAEVTNLASEPKVFSAFAAFQLEDSTEEKYDPVALFGLPPVGGDIPPGGSSKGVVAWEIPEGSTNLRVIFRNVLHGGSEFATIYLS